MSRSLKQGLIGCSVVLIASCATLSELEQPLSQFSPSHRSPSPALTVAQSPAIADMEEQVYQRINDIRRREGLQEFRYNDRLAEVARRYSQRMAEGDFFSHTSPSGDTVVDRVRSVGIGYSMVGENLFTSTNLDQPVPAAVNGWMNSRGHRENILESGYRETGIGIWRVNNTYYFTQLFLRSPLEF